MKPAESWTQVPEVNPAPPPKPVKPFTLWSLDDFLGFEEDPASHLLLPKFLTRGKVTSFIGPPGVGKSRLLTQLAFTHILQRPWCGLETGGGLPTAHLPFIGPELPLEVGLYPVNDPAKVIACRWLILGDENSTERLKEDMEAMVTTLEAAEKKQRLEPRFGVTWREPYPPSLVHCLINAFLKIQVVETNEDGDLALDNPDVCDRLRETIKQWQPGIIVFDPLASFTSEDLSRPGGMRDAVRMIETAVRLSARKAATIISAHARTGSANMLQAEGWDAGNFMLGGKALLARSRAVINMAPADSKGTGNVAMFCAKSNDCRPFSPRGLTFNESSHTYSVNPEWSVDGWRADLAGKRPGSSLCTLKDVVEGVQSGYTATAAIVEAMMTAFCCSKAVIERHLASAKKNDYLITLGRGKWGLGKKANLLLKNEQ